MIIKVDMRETSLIEALKTLVGSVEKASVTILVEALPLGDCIIQSENGQERCIIERKTLKDLAASIRDGRYAEQSFRLNECSVHNHHVVYLIEGDLETYSPGRLKITKEALVSSFVTLNFYKGFSVHRTQTVTESANWLYQFANKLAKFQIPGHFESDEEGQKSNTAYSEVIKRTKKECINTCNIGEIMLSQIPNVSMAVAVYLMEQFGNVMHLASVLRTNPKAIDNMVITGKTGKMRTISRTARENIYRYLVSEVRQGVNED